MSGGLPGTRSTAVNERDTILSPHGFTAQQTDTFPPAHPIFFICFAHTIRFLPFLHCHSSQAAFMFGHDLVYS